jgi:hypothetical protein
VRRLQSKPEAKNTRNTKKCVIFQISDRRELRNDGYKAGYSGLGATYLAITAWYPSLQYPGTAKPWHKPDWRLQGCLKRDREKFIL